MAVLEPENDRAKLVVVAPADVPDGFDALAVGERAV
jgi:hypothetical protein